MGITVTLRRLDAALLPAFLPYLIPQAADAVASGAEDIIALGAVTGERKTCGAIAGELYRGVLTVFSLYVDPAVRRQGVGRLLLQSLLDCCPEARPEARWLLPEAQLGPLSAFLQAQGFIVTEEDSLIYRLDTADLRQVPVVRRAFSPSFRPDGNIVPLSALAEGELAELRADGSIDPRLTLECLADRLTPELSFCYRYRGRVAAYLLCGQIGTREVAVLSAVSRPGAHPAAILQLATAAIHQWLAQFGGDFFCWLEAINPASESLARALSGGTCQLWREGAAFRPADT